jgi:hypothetical protein
MCCQCQIPKTRIAFIRGRWTWQNSYGFDGEAYRFCLRLNLAKAQQTGSWWEVFKEKYR